MKCSKASWNHTIVSVFEVSLSSLLQAYPISAEETSVKSSFLESMLCTASSASAAKPRSKRTAYDGEIDRLIAERRALKSNAFKTCEQRCMRRKQLCKEIQAKTRKNFKKISRTDSLYFGRVSGF